MGTHPIFESDFDCLTEAMISRISCQSVRSFQTSRNLFKRIRSPRTQQNVLNETVNSVPGQAIPGYSVGAKLAAGASACGLGGLVFYGLNLSKNRAVDRATCWPQYIKDRISSTYNYLFQSLFITGAAAYGALRSPMIMGLASRGGILAFVGTLACMIGLQMGVHASPYAADEFNAQKKAFWALHATFIGCMMAPLVAMFGDVVAQAALYTGGLAGGISALGWVAPSKDSFNMMAPLAMGMGLVLVAAMASPFFSPTSPAGGALFSFVLWGGMILSGGLMFFHTQQMLSKAERHPLHAAKAYDPISASMGMYIAMVNMFQRLLFILGTNKRK